MAKKTKKKMASTGLGSTILAIKRPSPPTTEKPVVADVTPSPEPFPEKMSIDVVNQTEVSVPESV